MPDTSFPLTDQAIAAAAGAATTDVAANWPLVEGALEARGMRDVPVKIAAIATIAVETARTFRPIDEFGDEEYFTRMYEGRADLGNTRKGDGARFHGRGYIQLTGRSNYRTYGEKLGFPLEKRPELAKTPEVAAAVLADYFKGRGVDASAGQRDWESVRRKVNGGLNGWDPFRIVVGKLEAGCGIIPALPAGGRRPRTLVLTTPYMKGRDVVRVQRALGVDDDGEYGPVTAGAASAWKRRAGYLVNAIDTTLTEQDQRYLLGKDELPNAFRRRGEERARELAMVAGVPERAVEEMERWIGLRERPAGSNKVPALGKVARELGLSDWYQKMGWPWCAFTVFLAALRVGGQSAELGLRQGKFNALYCPAILAAAQGARFGMRVVAASEAARGDLVLFDWSPQGDPADHIGRLVRPPAGGVVVTVDGNSGTDDLLVVERERQTTQVRAYVRDS